MDHDEAVAALAAVMEPRRPRGWGYHDGGECWFFGIGGAGLLIVTALDGRFHLFDHITIEELAFDDASSLRLALPARERARRGLSPLQVDMLAADKLSLGEELLLEYHRQVAEQDRAFEQDGLG